MHQLKRRILIFPLISCVVFAVVMMSRGFSEVRNKNHVVIGAKNSTEQHLLAEMIAILLEEETDIGITRRFNLDGTFLVFNAIRSGSIDIYPEYVGTGIITILDEQSRGDSEKDFLFVKEEFEKKFSLTWLNSFGFHNTYVLLMDPKMAREMGIETMSDLKAHPNLSYAVDPEFHGRPEWELMKTHYHLPSKNLTILEHALMYWMLSNQNVEVINGYLTDGFIYQYQLKILADDQSLSPSYYAAPVIRQETIKKHPEIPEVLGRLAGKISNQKMQLLNYEVEKKGRNVYQVAREFLIQERLIMSQ